MVSHFSGLYLEKGKIYEAKLFYAKSLSTWWPLGGIRIPYHHAAGIRWDNLDKYAKQLKTHSKVYRVKFFVTKVEIEKMHGRRQWLSSYHCKIIKVFED